MATKKDKKSDGLLAKGEPDKFEIRASPDEPVGKTVARLSLDPLVRHANLSGSFANHAFGDSLRPSIMDTSEVLGDQIAKAASGDLTMASRFLAAQAVSLDSLFTELARRSGNNMGEYPQTMERYMRLALKAQSSCRATLETLARLHQPREQTVRHVHVNEGGRAVVADHFHHHTGGTENGKSSEQPHATGTTSKSPALPGPDPLGYGVPITGCEGAETVPNARRKGKRGASE